MSLIMQKRYRSKYESSVSYTMVFAVLFSFAIIIIGVAGYTLPSFNIGKLQSIVLVVFGAGILLFSLSNILMKATTGMTRNVSLVISILLISFFLILTFLGSGILEIG